MKKVIWFLVAPVYIMIIVLLKRITILIEHLHSVETPLSLNGGREKMYTYIICLDDELWDVLEDDIDIEFNGVRMVADRKTLTPAQKKTYRKHRWVRGILIEALPHS